MKIKYLLVVLSLIILAGCNTTQFKQINFSEEKYLISFDNDIPLMLKQEIQTFFGKDNSLKADQKNIMKIHDYKMKRYDIYSGDALRALEIEMNVSIILKIQNNQKAVNKKIDSARRFSSSELNPLSEKEMLQFIEEELINDLINKIVIEVSLIDL